MPFSIKIIGLLLLLLILCFSIMGLAERCGFPEGLAIAFCMVLLVVIVFWMCFLSDEEKKRTAIKRIKNKMEALSPVPKEAFEEAFDADHIDIAYKARNEIASFFGIETEKISPSCKIWDEFSLKLFAPFFLTHIEYKVFPELHESLTRRTIVATPAVSKDMDFSDFVRNLKTYRDDFVKRHNIQLNGD